MKIIKVKKLPFDFSGITIWPFIFFLKGQVISNTLLRHETIHLKQQRETLWRFFFIFYIAEFVVKFIYHFCRNISYPGTFKDFLISTFFLAYRDLSFEREAYAHEKDENYLKTRKPFAWIKYVFK